MNELPEAGRFSPRKVLRRGVLTVVEGEYEGQPSLAKVTSPLVPWTRPDSAFFGGAGLVPPFVPLPLHEAAAWKRVAPERVLDAGQDDQAAWVVLARVPGAPLSEPVRDPAALLRQLAGELHRLHGADVLHQDLRPDNVMMDGDRAVVVDLDIARVAGLGPAGRLGSRRWVAPEVLRGEVTPRSDLYALGRVVATLAQERAISTPVADLLAALQADSPSDRPASAAEVLRSLGEHVPEVDPVSEPHPALAAWWAGAWVDPMLAEGDPWRVVRVVDEAPPDRWTLAGVASRLLAVAPQAGREIWLALGTLCALLADRFKKNVDLHRAQVLEARDRARAPWHPAHGWLTHLAEPGADVAHRIVARASLGLPRAALRDARQVNRPSLMAVAAFRAGEDREVERALEAARPPDRWAVSVAASRLVRLAPGKAEPRFLAHAFPDIQVDAVRRLLAEGREKEARALLPHLSPEVAPRAELALDLGQARLERAQVVARSLAEAGRWDPTVATVLLLDPHVPDPVRRQAIGILSEGGEIQVSGDSAIARLGDRPESTARWALALRALVDSRSWTRAGELMAHAAGPVPWRLLVLLLLQRGLLPSARQVGREALERFSTDVSLLLLAAGVELLAREPDEARRLAERALRQEPEEVGPHLLASLAEAVRGRPAAARRHLAVARSLDARHPGVEATARALREREQAPEKA